MRSITMALTALAVLAAPHASAQTQRGGGEAQKMMQQFQQLAAEKTGLQAQVAQLQKDLDAAKGALAAMKKERDASKAQTGAVAAAIAQANAGKAGAEQGLEQSRQRMTDLVNRFRETAVELKQAESERENARTALAERNEAFDKCAEANLRLYEVNSEILDRYEHVGLFTKVSAAEPFTKVTRTRIENLVDDYRGRAQELRVKKTAGNPK
jgi:chromosome segregation ATPase